MLEKAVRPERLSNYYTNEGNWFKGGGSRVSRVPYSLKSLGKTPALINAIYEGSTLLLLSWSRLPAWKRLFHR